MTAIQISLASVDPHNIVKEVWVRGLAFIMMDEYREISTRYPHVQQWYQEIELIAVELATKEESGSYLSVDNTKIYSISSGVVTAMYYICEKGDAHIISLTKPSYSFVSRL